MFKKNNKKGRWGSKAQVFVIATIIAVTVALTTSYILLHYMFKETNPDQHLGSYQSAIVDSLADADKTLLYVDQASKMAVASAFDTYINGNPKPALDGDTSTTDVKYCGSYVYRLWNSVNADCYPNYNSQDFEINSLINNNLAKQTYLQTAPTKEKYLDSVIKQKVTYEYTYYSPTTSEDYSTIKGNANTGYTIYAFRDEEARESGKVLNYVNKQVELSGGTGDIAGVPFIPPAPDNYRQANTREIKYLVIHYTAGYSIKDAMTVFLTPGKKSSSHYILGRTNDNFKTIQVVRDKDVAYHAGCDNAVYGCRLEEYKMINTNSIGIEVVNSGFLCDDVSSCKNSREESLCVDKYIITGIDKQGTGSLQCWQKYPDEQYKKLVALSAIIVKKYNIPIDRQHIIGHVEIVLKNKVDPGPAFDLDKFVSDIKTATSQSEAVLAGIVYSANSQDCLKSDKTDWKIKDVKLSATQLTSSQGLKISVDFENSGDTCVNVKPKIYFKTTNSKQRYTNQYLEYISPQSINVYKKSDASPYTGAEIKCTFTTDKELAKTERSAGNCVIDVPDTGAEITYYIDVEATDYNNKLVTYGSLLQITVKKDSGTPQAENVIPAAIVQLSKSEQTKFDSTKRNLEGLNIMDYITEQTTKENVPKAIVLGLITQESGGNMRADSGFAYGLMQVTKETFDGTKFVNKCTWEEHKNDVQCQIRAGIAVLKAKYAGVDGKTIYYKCSLHCPRLSGGKITSYETCKNSCPATGCIGPVDASYTGWEAALRRYNGGGWEDGTKTDSSGCGGYPDYEYVDRVMKYAAAWGYAGGYDSKVKEEMDVGILGTYSIKPTFNVKMDFDMTLFDMLIQFSKDSVKKCGVKGVNREKCIQNSITDFNKKLPAKHANQGVELNNSCDEGIEMTSINKFVEEVSSCMMSEDNNCQCQLTDSDIKIKAESVSGSTKITYYSNTDNRMHQSYFDYSVIQKDGKHWTSNSVNIKEVILSKNGTEALLGVSNTKKCSVPKNKFRLCLNTNYRYTVYDASAPDRIKEKRITIPFAITVRDDTPPAPITSLTYNNIKHAKNDVVLKWKARNESDIVKYNIYLSDTQTPFTSRQTQYFKDYMKVKSIAAAFSSDYLEYQSIDVSSPKCKISTPSDPQLTYNYCVFEYAAVDKNNNAVNIQLEQEKLYYLNITKEFIYLLDGANADNGFTTSKSKFIAVTAVDIDSNEIDNIEADEKISLGKNLIDIKPEDLLEAGFTKITNVQINNNGNTNSNALLSWEATRNYIDGTPIEPERVNTIKYKVYIGRFGCSSGAINPIRNLNALGGGIGPYSRNEGVGIPIGSLAPGDYCVGVSVLSSNNLEYESTMTNSMQITASTP